MSLNGIEIGSSTNETLLRVILGNDLKFDAESNPYVERSLRTCPLIWMFCSKALINPLNSIYERALRLVHDNYKSSFYLLEMLNDKTIHQ